MLFTNYWQYFINFIWYYGEGGPWVHAKPTGKGECLIIVNAIIVMDNSML